MNSRLLNVLVVTFIILLAAANPSVADTRWSKLAAKDEGFSIDVPGEPQPSTKPGQHAYTSGLWSFYIQSHPVAPVTGELVERGDRKAIAKCLEGLRDAMINGVKAKRRSSSFADVDGYPSLLFSLEGEIENLEMQGTNRLVLTEERMYILATIGPKGTAPNADIRRFLDSFHLVKAEPAPARTRTRGAASSKDPLMTKMAGPMLAVARLITEEKLNPLIDQVLQNVPAAARLGSRWNSSHAAWQKARTSLSGRIALIANLYEKSGELERELETELARLAPGSKADALAAVVNGEARSGILREHASIQFVVTIMANDPNGPKAGERAWTEKMGALKKVFDARIGSSMPPDDGMHAADVRQYLASETGRVFMNLWSSVVGKATVQLEGAVNLMIFDDREAIMREIEAAIANVK